MQDGVKLGAPGQSLEPMAADGEVQGLAGKAGWPTLAALGVSYVICGDYAGWNYGFAEGGWGGMVLAVCLMAVMYLCLALSLAELGAMLPSAGGGATFASAAFGPAAGVATGMLVATEYLAGSALVATFLNGYVEQLFGIGGPVLSFLCFAIFIAIHLTGANETMRLILILTAVAIAGIGAFILSMATRFDPVALMRGGGGVGAGFLPFGPVGIWHAIPFAMALFLALEGIPLAAEDARNPARDVPRALIAAWAVLFVLAMGLIVTAPGAAGIGPLLASDSPLVSVIQTLPASSGYRILSLVVNIAALLAIASSLFSVIYAFSRQIYALARDGHLPAIFARVNRRGAPDMALILPGVGAFLMTLTGAAQPLVLATMFSAAASYMIMMAAFLRLRHARTDMTRPYRTPAGIAIAGTALILASGCAIACAVQSPIGALAILLATLGVALWSGLRSAT